MRNFALLNENNLVINISVADDNWDSTGWLEYTNKPCGIGFTYNQAENIFIAPQPYPSWIREGSYWYAPIEYPTDGKNYTWNEETQTWDLNETTSK
tara:strand:- start:1733 stop:2020 length:288 start_codon:yes stop_codon:yes gene_type:complete